MVVLAFSLIAFELLPESSSQCYFLRRVGMALRWKSLHPECTECAGNKVVLSLIHTERRPAKDHTELNIELKPGHR